MGRIADRHLQALCDRLNKLTNSPAKTYALNESGKRCAHIGNFHIGSAYSGVQLQRIANDAGGITTPLGGGYGTKRALYEKMSAFIAGLEFKA